MAAGYYCRTMDVLDRLERWYEAQCDGDWEHGFGPQISTIDNPGWRLKVDLHGTDCDGRILEPVENNYDHDTEWWRCWTEGNEFHGAGGPRKLRAILETFRAWVEACNPSSQSV